MDYKNQLERIKKFIISSNEVNQLDKDEMKNLEKNYYEDDYLSYQSLEALHKHDENTRRFNFLVMSICRRMKDIYYDYFKDNDSEESFILGIKLMIVYNNIFLTNFEKMRNMNKNNNNQMCRALFLINRVSFFIDHINIDRFLNNIL